MKKLLSTFLCIGFMSIQAQDAQVISNLSDDIENASISLSQTLGEIAVTDVAGPSISLNQGFHNAIPKIGVQLSVRVFLQGAYDEVSGLLRDDLRAQSYIPSTSPYIDALTVSSPTVFDTAGSNAIVDWVFVEVRDRSLSDLVVAEQSALLQRDGDVVGLDGVSPLEFDVYPGTYFLSVSHRNHLGVISNTTEVLSKDAFVLDFTDGSVVPKGGINGRWEFGDGALALIAGNVNGNNTVNILGTNNDSSNLRDFIFNNPSNIFGFPSFTFNGYSNFDVNLNGASNILGTENDASLLRTIIIGAQGNIFGFPSFTFTQQF